MKKPVAAKGEAKEITVLQITTGQIDFCILGKTPLICNRMSEKAKRELLFPGPTKTRADRASNLKHDPKAEYTASPYTSKDKKSPTFLIAPSTWFKGALRSVALDMPGSSKAEMGRLTYVVGDYIDLYGVPQLLMSVTRSADAARTPDIRTRAILPEWACKISVTYVKPLLKEQTIINLVAAAGIMRGVGDYRPEKGAGDYGQFELVSADNSDFRRIMKTQGRIAQEKAIANPEMYDEETADLMAWFDVEIKRRGFKVVGGTAE